MSYSLEQWDILISTTIHPDNLHRFTTSEDWQTAFISQSEIEKEKLRTLLVKDFVDGARQEKIEFLVQFNQGILIRLLDKLHQYRSSSAVPEQALLLYESISAHVSFILDFIEEYFTRYFDHNEKVPASYLVSSKEDISGQLEYLHRILSANGEDDLSLINMIITNFSNFCNAEKSGYSYNDLIYQKELLKELMSLTRYPEQILFHKALEEKLVYMNFNSSSFIEYLLSEIYRELEQAATVKNKVAVLFGYQRRFSLTNPRPAVSLHAHCPGVKETILNFTDKELLYLHAVPNEHAPPSSSTEKTQVHVQFKGTEIYLFHKAFIDAGGAPGETYKSILEKTAAHLSNKTKKGFSVESLQKNSDKVDYESKENLKRFLTKMIRNIDSY